MLTPKEVSEHAFAKAAFGGYSMAMVDEFLDAVTEDYTALYKENAALKAKMKVLVDKIEEYRSTEEGMRKTLLTAQNMADEMVREAEAKRDQMLVQVEKEARAQLVELNHELEQAQARLAAAQAATAEYVAKVQSLYRQEMAHLDEIANEMVPVPVAQPEPDPVADAVADIEASMAQMLEDEEDTLSFEPVSAQDEEPEEEEVVEEEAEDDDDDLVFARRLNLEDLRFGRDFDMN